MGSRGEGRNSAPRRPPHCAPRHCLTATAADRLSIAGRDFVDGVCLSPREFYDEMRTNPVPPRTSQPPPGDFRRMFEFLLAHHERVIDVSLGSVLSGTLQSAAGAASRTAKDRINVFDTGHVAAAQGLLAIWAAEAAQ